MDHKVGPEIVCKPCRIVIISINTDQCQGNIEMKMGVLWYVLHYRYNLITGGIIKLDHFVYGIIIPEISLCSAFGQDSTIRLIEQFFLLSFYDRNGKDLEKGRISKKHIILQKLLILVFKLHIIPGSNACYFVNFREFII